MVGIEDRYQEEPKFPERYLMLFSYVEDLARKKAKAKIQLRVFKDNPAQSLYHRIGFKIVEDQDWCFLMEKDLKVD